MINLFNTLRGMTYVVAKVDKRSTPFTYQVKELDGTPLKPKYYAEQLLTSPDPYKEVLPVESWLKSRGKGANKEYLVKWLNYG